MTIDNLLHIFICNHIQVFYLNLENVS